MHKHTIHTATHTLISASACVYAYVRMRVRACVGVSVRVGGCVFVCVLLSNIYHSERWSDGLLSLFSS